KSTELPWLDPLAAIAAVHPDDWWWAVIGCTQHRRPLTEAAATLPDDLDALLAWLPTLEAALPVRGQIDLERVERVSVELATWIDRSYRKVERRDANDNRLFHALWNQFY